MGLVSSPEELLNTKRSTDDAVPDKDFVPINFTAPQGRDLAAAPTAALQPPYISGGNRWDNSTRSPTQMQR